MDYALTMNSNSDRDANRDNRISILRAIACIGIVVLHTTYIANITFTDSYGLVGNIASNAARNLMLFAVPVFVMITGALLLSPEKRITLEKLFKKYILRMVIAIVVFAVLYQVFDSLLIDGDLGFNSIVKGLKEALTTGSWSTLWYPYLLIALYLFLPFYRMIAEKAGEKEYAYLLIVYLAFLTILPILGLWKIKSGFYITVSSIYPFYLFYGYGVYSGRIKISRAAGLLLMLIGSILTIGLTIYRWKSGNESLEMFRDYNAINVVLQACGVFALVFGNAKEDQSISQSINKSLSSPDAEGSQNSWLTKALLNLDDNSFGIYLIHIIIIKWLFRVISFNPYTNGGATAFIGLIIGILTISWLITFILRRVGVIRKIL